MPWKRCPACKGLGEEEILLPPSPGDDPYYADRPSFRICLTCAGKGEIYWEAQKK